MPKGRTIEPERVFSWALLMSGPDAFKLSDRRRPSQACWSEAASPPMPVRWSAWLGGGTVRVRVM